MNEKPPILVSRVLWVGAGLAVIIAGAAVLFFFDPETAGFYPVCGIHQLTGLQCPGCGSLRALHQLTHGNIAAAWHFNPLLVALLPIGFWLGLRAAALWVFGWRWPGIINKPIVGWAIVVVAIVFGIARNIP
ncbi:MAG TPA: DUF2752 domain-containing protein [Verrucomicrobiae bacterium]|jgi:hypothetical protein|nr:DUF2752 domain-containing protein [Verrucomicrobiae bacterium]